MSSLKSVKMTSDRQEQKCKFSFAHKNSIVLKCQSLKDFLSAKDTKEHRERKFKDLRSCSAFSRKQFHYIPAFHTRHKETKNCQKFDKEIDKENSTRKFDKEKKSLV